MGRSDKRKKKLPAGPDGPEDKNIVAESNASKPAKQKKQPRVVPPAEKRPWLLGLAALLLSIWFVTLVVLAIVANSAVS